MTEQQALKAEAMLRNLREQVRNQGLGWDVNYDANGRLVFQPNVCGETVVLNLWAAVAASNKAGKP